MEGHGEVDSEVDALDTMEKVNNLYITSRNHILSYSVLKLSKPSKRELCSPHPTLLSGGIDTLMIAMSALPVNILQSSTPTLTQLIHTLNLQ